MSQYALALTTAANSAFTDALGLAMLIGAGFSLVGVLIVARFMPARDTNVSEDDESQSARELELEGPLAPPMSEPAVSVRELSKTYPGGVEAVKGISFDVCEGEIFGILADEMAERVHAWGAAILDSGNGAGGVQRRRGASMAAKGDHGIGRWKLD